MYVIPKEWQNICKTHFYCKITNFQAPFAHINTGNLFSSKQLSFAEKDILYFFPGKGKYISRLRPTTH